MVSAKFSSKFCLRRGWKEKGLFSGWMQGRRTFLDRKEQYAEGRGSEKAHPEPPRPLWFPREPGNRRLKGLGDPIAESGCHYEESGLDPAGNTEAVEGLESGAGLGSSAVMRLVP